jgi:signal transduction histidine kinase
MAVDIGLGLFVLVTTSIAMLARLEPDARDAGWPMYLFALGLAAPLLWRRRWPVAVLLVTVAVLLGYYAWGFPAIGLAVPLAAALFSTAEQGRLGWAIGTSLGLLVATTALRWAQGQDLTLLLAYETPLSATLMAAVVFLGDSIRSRQALVGEFQRRVESQAEQRRLAAEQLAERERLRLARDLHDTIGHTMTVIGVQAAVAAEALDAAEIAGAQTAVAAIRSASRDSMAELRAALGQLRDPGATPARQPAPDLSGLPALAEQARTAGLRVDLSVEETLPDLPSALARTIHRVVQESLTNVLRHAQATQVSIQLARDGQELRLSVRDNGTGGPVAAGSSGQGLAGMRERVGLLGGSCQAGRRADGFEVEVRLPVPLEPT